MIVKLDTSNGYQINPLTGESINDLFNSEGFKIKTGHAIQAKDYIPTGFDKISFRLKKTIRPARIPIIKNNPSPSIISRTIKTDTGSWVKKKWGKGTIYRLHEEQIRLKEPVPVTAAPPRYRENAIADIQYLDVEEGLISSSVFCTMEDHLGNLWFGTDGGLSCYDGVRFKNYFTEHGLSGNTILSLLEDKKGRIWIGTSNGLNRFDGNKMSRFPNTVYGNRINNIMEDQQGKIWISTSNGLACFNENEFTHYNLQDGLSSDTIESCLQDRRGNFWVGCHDGIIRISGDKFSKLTKNEGLYDNSINKLKEDKNGSIWIATLNSLNSLDDQSITSFYFKDSQYPHFIPSGLEIDEKGSIWISIPYQGVYRYHNGQFIFYSTEEGLSSNKPTNGKMDRFGNYWVGTDGGGVNRINTNGFHYLPANLLTRANKIRPLLKDRNDQIWMGTEGTGIASYQQENKRAPEKGFNYYAATGIDLFKGQRSFLEDRDGNIWIGSTEDGVYRFNGQSFEQLAVSKEHTWNTVYSLLEDRAGRIWFSQGNKGLFRYDNNSIAHFTDKNGLTANKIYCINQDPKGIIWLGTDGGGLTSYDGFRFKHYSPREGLFSKTITSIINDKNGDLWLGTSDAGVCRFNGKSFTYYTQKEGLSNNMVWSLFADPGGHIWAGTENGLNRLIPAENGTKIVKYGRQDGLKASDFNLHSVTMTGNKSIWWGTGKNVVMKDPDSLSLSGKINTPRLSQIEINEKLYDFRHFPDSLRNKIKFSSVVPFAGYPDQLSLSHDQNHLRFYFSAIDWAAPDKILYSFRLMGIDKEWSKPSSTPFAEYRNLSHGEYEFHLKAAGRSQTWSDSFIYRFTIRPAWWQRIWFRSFVILLLLTGIFLLARLIYLYQLRKQRGLMEQQLAVQMERQRISAEMHDDIGAGLSGIRLLTEMTRNKIKDDQSMKDVEKIYQSVGDISSKMKEVIWSLNTENDHLSNLLSYLQQQIRLWLEHYPCQLKISLPAEIPDQPVNGEDRRNIFLIVKEAVHNMIKHSGADQLEVVMEYNAGQLRIKIADNGRGIEEQQTGKTGNGMRNMQQRAEMLRGKMEAESNNGLTLTFTIPI